MMSKMKSKPKVSIVTEREVITYSQMWHTSECLFQRGQEQEAGSFHQFMASLVFTAFTLEAYLNHVGSRLFRCWDDLEHLGHDEKLNLIAEHLGVTINRGIRPWQDLKKLFGFRNSIAHGKSKAFKPPVRVVSLEEHEADVSMVRTEWELFCTQEAAKSARADVEKVVFTLYEAAKAAGCDTGRPFVKGGQHSDVSLCPPEPTRLRKHRPDRRK
jgi:hypothetical protein